MTKHALTGYKKRGSVDTQRNVFEQDGGMGKPMFNFGGMEILAILMVALLVLGPEKLPRFMRTVGKAVGDLRRVSTEFQRTVNLEIDAGADNLEPKQTDPGTRHVDSAAAKPHGEPNPAPHTADAVPLTPLSQPSPKRKSMPRAKLARRPRPRSRSKDPDTDTP